MSAPFHGGPAFPAAPNPNYTDDANLGQRGMTMRQYYKAAALQGMLAATDHDAVNWPDAITIAKRVAGYADALLAEDKEAGK